MVFYLFIALLGGYLLGSVNPGILISKYILGKDVRSSGSGNAGATNVARVFGMKVGLAVFAGDLLKTVLGMLLGRLVCSENGFLIAGLGCAIGHCFPLYFNFKGGKGVTVAAAVALMVDWRVFLSVIACFAVIVLLSKIVSLSSILTGVAYPFLFYVWGNNDWKTVALAVIVALLAIAMHHENIRRLLAGQESRFKAHKDSE